MATSLGNFAARPQPDPVNLATAKTVTVVYTIRLTDAAAR